MKITYTLDMTPEEFKLGVQFLRFALTKLTVLPPQAVWPLPEMPNMPDVSGAVPDGLDPSQFDPEPSLEGPPGTVKVQLKLNGEDETLHVSSETLEKGRVFFCRLVEDWSVDFGAETEPDRSTIMEQHAQAPEAGAALVYVAWKGGLTRAIHACSDLPEKTVRAMALHIAQVASLMHPDLADQLEARNPLKGA